MDEALIRPKKARRVVRIQPLPADAPPDAREDVTSQGTLVEVADAGRLRPRDFRVDFVYGAKSPLEDVAQCDLPPALESVLAGTDAAILVLGAAGAGQAELLDGPGGLAARASARLLAELTARQKKHRQGGGGFAFQLKLRHFQLSGQRIDDLMTDRPESSNLLDSVDGVRVEGVRAVTVVSEEEVADVIGKAQARRQAGDAAQRGLTAGVFSAEVTQADYWGGWGLFATLIVLEVPAVDCLAEDRGMVQLREGYDTYRGLFHLRGLLQAWEPQKPPSDVTSTALTWLLRDVLCSGSVAPTVILCLRQLQPHVSIAALELLGDFSKLETNPVCCDHRVAGWGRALRAEWLQARLPGRAGASDREGQEEARRIILELERRLHAAERGREDAERAGEQRRGRAAELQDRFATAVQGQAEHHSRLLASEEDRIRSCEALVESQAEHNKALDELSELRYQDGLMMLTLEQDVTTAQAATKLESEQSEQLAAELRDARDQGDLLRGSVDNLERDTSELQNSYQHHSRAYEERSTALRESLAAEQELERGTLRNRAEALELQLQDRAAAELRSETAARHEASALRRGAAVLGEELQQTRTAEAEAQEAAAALEAELAGARGNFVEALAGLAGGGGEAPLAKLTEFSRDGAEREQGLLSDRLRLQAAVRALRAKLSWAAGLALDWAPPEGSEKDRTELAAAVADASARGEADATAGSGKDRELGDKCRVLQTEVEAQRQQLALVHAEHAQELRRRDAVAAKREAEVMELQHQSKTGAARSPLEQIQEQLLSEFEALRGGAAGVPSSSADLVEKNRALQAKVDSLEQQTPANQRAQSQRLVFLERGTRELENERSGLLVRATVAEEQLVQLQRHLKEMTESYQMQIVNLKIQAGRADATRW